MIELTQDLSEYSPLRVIHCLENLGDLSINWPFSLAKSSRIYFITGHCPSACVLRLSLQDGIAGEVATKCPNPPIGWALSNAIGNNRSVWTTVQMPSWSGVDYSLSPAIRANSGIACKYIQCLWLLLVNSEF